MDLYQSGLLDNASCQVDPASDIRKAVKDLCIRLIPDSIALTDSFGFSDWELDRRVRSALFPSWSEYN